MAKMDDTLIAKGLNLMADRFNGSSPVKTNQTTKYFNILVKDDVIISVAESNVHEAKRNLEKCITNMEKEQIRLERLDLKEEESLDQHKKVVAAYNAVTEAREGLKVAERQLEAVERVFLGTKYFEKRVANEPKIDLEAILEEEQEEKVSYSRVERQKKSSGLFSFFLPSNRKH